MKLEKVPIDSLVLDPANARRHPEKNLEAVKGSLARFGQRVPLVVTGDNVIRAGNARWLAAKALGWKEVWIIRADDLAGAEAVAFAITDNKTGLLGEWDYETLAASLKSLLDENVDLSKLGWEGYELEGLLQADWKPPPLGSLEDTLPTPLPPAAATGEDTRLNRIVISYADEEEKRYLAGLLGVSGTQVVYSVEQIRKERGEA